MTAMPGKCTETLLLIDVSPFTASRMWSRQTVARSHFCFGCLHSTVLSSKQPCRFTFARTC